MAEDRQGSETLDLCTFQVGETTCGIDILCVQEINSQMDFTAVPLAPDYVFGVTNLRGRVVTVIDLKAKLGLGAAVLGEHSRNVIVNSESELVGLLVDHIADVIAAAADAIEPPPANVGADQIACFEGVVKQDGALINILDVTAVLKDET